MPTPVHKRRSSRWSPLVMAVAALLTFSPVVLADVMVPDGNGGTANAFPLQFGNVCAGQTYTGNVPIYIQRLDAATDPTRVFNDGALVTISSAGAASHAYLSGTITDTTIQLPGDWESRAANFIWLDDTAAVSVVLAVAAAALPGASGTQTLNLQAKGTNSLETGVLTRGIADPQVTWTVVAGCPDVTINKAGSQADPTTASPIHFTAVFTEPVTGFTSTDVVLSGTAGATTAVVTQIAPNDGTTYDIAVSGMTGSGTVIASIPGKSAVDASNAPNTASTSTDNEVEYIAGFPLEALSDVHAWVGLRNSDDQGTQFDLQAELLQGDTVVATGLTRCVTGVTRNPSLAKEVVIAWDAFSDVTLLPGDVVSLRLSTRIGTTPAGAKCTGPTGGSHNNATGLRFYYDSTTRPSRFDWTLTPNPSTDEYLHSDGNACTSAQSTGVTTRFLNDTAPTATSPKCKDSTSINFNGGNPYSVIGTWSITL